MSAQAPYDPALSRRELLKLGGTALAVATVARPSLIEAQTPKDLLAVLTKERRTPRQAPWTGAEPGDGSHVEE